MLLHLANGLHSSQGRLFCRHNVDESACQLALEGVQNRRLNFLNLATLQGCPVVMKHR